MYSASELAYQLKSSKAKVLFTCVPLLKTALLAAAEAGIPKNRVYLLSLPKELIGVDPPKGFKSVDDLIAKGRNLGKLEPLKFAKGEGARRVAFLCYSSGTSGLPVCGCRGKVV
jgi:ribosome assembly protein SQT1